MHQRGVSGHAKPHLASVGLPSRTFSPPLWTTTTLHFIVEAVALATEIAPSFLAFLTSDRASGRHHMRSENAATRRDT
ncbi:hypothetical protein CGCS363_v000593 [Colletotrichum siamense]|uniref:uncharacterized protein n=1 Tax=Colletotrichum siamense TaxID=690259 RepID=UPI0018723C68|nr:uncharacterized protein CGCS363_v000593 [Colletotrichum siamense]KAF5515899.1 hypothetical protein CGCS363_v000593 [Colletotrichum siamense]